MFLNDPTLLNPKQGNLAKLLNIMKGLLLDNLTLHPNNQSVSNFIVEIDFA